MENSKVLMAELEWLSRVLNTRLDNYFQKQTNPLPLPPAIVNGDTIYGKMIQSYNMTLEERLTLILALAPHIKPELLDVFFVQNELYKRPFTEFGGTSSKTHLGFLPTAETVVFILSKDLPSRLSIFHFFQSDHFLFKHNILRLEQEKGEPVLSSALKITDEYLHNLLLGRPYEPIYGFNFPAQKISSRLEWKDLIVQESVLMDLDEICVWIKSQPIIMAKEGLRKRLRLGFRTLFYGPPGTGKTLAASLLGKVTGLQVYRIDLSMVVSKFIGETEKNLAGIFDQAASKNWILFFDEADALFGQRTVTTDAKDRYANQEVAYLLQRIEDFDGVIVLATNLRTNLDIAFARRFQSIVHFPIPNKKLRLKLWESSFEDTFELDEKVNLKEIAAKYELTGGAIINVLRYCALAAVNRNPQLIFKEDIVDGIRREMRKEGKTV